ncbi:MAG: VWA domain-containing protein [Cyanobacteria bacterium]|nr:VWA domain-containing protein [Cyanobacteriota bacterium]
MTTSFNTKNTKDTKALFYGCVVLFAIVVVSQHSAQEPLPRFRSGANLVTVDAYFTNSGKPVTDLKQDEIEILEDGRPQAIESFRVITPRGPGAPRSKPDPATAAASRAAAADPEARVFVVFFDNWHVSTDGSLKAAAPVSEMLNRVVGENDLVGVMTPDTPARTLSWTRRSDAIERVVRDTTMWGQRDRLDTSDPREREIAACYPEDPRRPRFAGVAKEMIERRREQKTLRALDDLITHLGGLRDERKFVVLLTEGWVLFRQNEQLAAILDPENPTIPGPPGVGVERGRITTENDKTSVAYDRGFASCERERSLLAFLDHTIELRQLAQRANRANVTFYAVDPRGLAAFDDSIGPMRPATPEQDRTRMASRQGGLRELANNTDGAVVLNTNDVKGGVARMLADLGASYVMQYYSTNPKLDGRFRSIAVRVTRPGVEVRARQGYLAPTEGEMRAMTAAKPSLPDGASVIKRRAAITARRRGPSTGLAYVRAEQPTFRRTERLRIEVDMPEGAANVAGRVLTAQSQPMTLPVGYTAQQVNGKTIGIADVTLAPLAAGHYSLELTFEVNGQKESAAYEFRIVP